MGRPVAAPIQAFFGPGGGTLGRSPDCTLALPDEGRHISRQQARVEVAGGATSITCLSAANPLIINGQELRQGQSRRLSHGDRIHVADYELHFEERDDLAGKSARAPDPLDPFADPFNEPFEGPAVGSVDPFAIPRRQPGPPASPAAQVAAIPDEFDPFNAAPTPPLSASGDRSVRERARDPLGLGLDADPIADLAAGRAESIDALFGLEAGSGDPLGPDSPLGRPAGEAPRAPPDFGSAAAPMADDASVLAGSFRLPQAIPPTEFGLSNDPVLSWKNESDAVHEAVLPPAPAADPAEIAAITHQALDADGLDFEATPGSLPTDVPGGSNRLPHEANADARALRGNENPADLLNALLLGLGLGELPSGPGLAGSTDRAGQAPAPEVTPELMRRLGELLAAACDGTVALLQARATLKQQLRADVTMIGARDNNPLKFVPDGQAALNQLLSPRPVRGFMYPQHAMRDAYDDLLAHQFGFVAGMRAAMQGLIGRFDPAVLEGRLASKSVLDAMLPAARKARLWELFNSLYAEVSREAEDDFERLFGHAFVKAYEEQIARIEAASRQRPG